MGGGGPSKNLQLAQSSHCLLSRSFPVTQKSQSYFWGGQDGSGGKGSGLASKSNNLSLISKTHRVEERITFFLSFGDRFSLYTVPAVLELTM